ncbi:class I SAM-dependent methyltransferase [Nocardioides marinquilinus]|uniref:Class I SAM-dependent methyltransferase n=1 Tax=Nocardioides marinquilinus TaxID=1210400 RepID=A0ABP9PZR7_9ACTN
MPDAAFAHPRLAPLYDPLEDGRDDLDAYERLATELGARRVLDVGCGTGVLALRLAAAGLDVVGADPAAASLDVARAKPGAEGVEWLCVGAADVPALGADLAVMTGNVAQVFVTDEEWRAALRAVRDALRPGGHLVFETRRPEARDWERWDDDREHVHEVPGEGRVGTRRRLTDVSPPLVTFEVEVTFHDDPPGVPERTLVSTSTLRFRTLDELGADLVACGLVLREVREAPDRPGLEHVVLATRA